MRWRPLRPEERRKQEPLPEHAETGRHETEAPSASGVPLFLQSATPIQAKLEVGSVDDPMEQQADRIAGEVLNSTSSMPLNHSGAANTAGGGTARPATTDVQQALNSPGQPLDSAVRGYFEPRFGRDLSDVRVHTGGQAAESARDIGARGYASGQHIVFAPGQFAPSTAEGRHLLAHELAHVSQQENESVAAFSPVRRQVFGPAEATGAGSDFDEFLLQFQALEAAAIADGYSFDDRITAFRKIYYDSASPAKTYAGAGGGGGAWNILIPGAAGTKLPPSWSDPTLKGAVDFIRGKPVMTIAGNRVDVGHLLAGADAAAHPAKISVGMGMVNLRSNVEATTFVGDLGSVVAEYIHGSSASFRDTAMERSPLLDTYYDKYASVEDMAGNADAYASAFDKSKTITENLRNYYAVATGGVKKRYTSFAANIGLGALTTYSMSFTGFPGATTAWRDALQGEIFNSALAYAAGKGWKGEVINVLNDPGPGIIAPTFWEMYWNVSGWTLDIFLARLRAEVAKE